MQPIGSAPRQVLVHQRHIQAVPQTLQPADDGECLRQKGRPRKTSPAPVRIDVRTQKVRLRQGLRETFGNPAVSPESTADYTGLRESYLGSPEKSSPARQTTRICIPLDASCLEKGEINSVLNSILKTQLNKVELLMY